MIVSIRTKSHGRRESDEALGPAALPFIPLPARK